MKLGPFNFAVTRRAPKPPAGEIGLPGANVQHGIVGEEYQTDLVGAKGFQTYEKMLRNDGQIQALELSVTLPIRAVDWHVDPAKGDNSRAGREAAELLQANLLSGGMTISWDEVLRHALLGALCGVEVFEKVWEIRDGMVVWNKLAPRAPKTIWRWEHDNGSGQEVITQYAPDNAGGFRKVEIPAEKILRCTWRGDHGNPEGRGLLRPAYTHWWIKHFVYKILNVSIARFGTPTPVGHLPPNFSDDMKTEFLAILEDYKSGESTGIALPPDYSIELLEAAMRAQGVQGYVEYQDTMILRSVLAQFLQLGASSSGSRAVADTQSEFFLLALDAVIDWVCDNFNRSAIPQWVAYNYPGMRDLPTLQPSGIRSVLQAATVAQGLAELANATLLTPDDSIENTVRDWFDLPPLPEDHQRALAPPAEPDQAGLTGAIRSTSSGQARPTGQIRVRASEAPARQRAYDPLPALQRGRQLASDAKRFQDDMERVVADQHERLLAKLQPIIEDFQAAEPMARGKHIARMQDVRVPLVAKYEQMLRGWLWSLYSTARERAAAEFSAQPGPVSNEMRQWINAKAQVLAQDHAERLRASTLHELLNLVKQDLRTADILSGLGQVMGARAHVDLTEGLRAAGEDLVGLINGALVAAQNGARAPRP